MVIMSFVNIFYYTIFDSNIFDVIVKMAQNNVRKDKK